MPKFSAYMKGEGVKGDTGSFGEISITTYSSSTPIANVTSSGPDSNKSIAFEFGLPRGEAAGFSTEHTASITTTSVGTQPTIEVSVDPSSPNTEKSFNFDFTIPEPKSIERLEQNIVSTTSEGENQVTVYYNDGTTTSFTFYNGKQGKAAFIEGVTTEAALLPPEGNHTGKAYIVGIEGNKRLYVYIDGEWQDQGPISGTGFGEPTGNAYILPSTVISSDEGDIVILNKTNENFLQIKDIKVNINPVQDLSNGSPSPTNICPINGWSTIHIYRESEYDTNADPQITIDLDSTCYGGTLDVMTGMMTVTDDNIPSYAGETLPSTWISSMDVYEEGTTPTTGAQVVYKLASPQTVQLTPATINLLLDENNIWANTGDITIEYSTANQPYIEVSADPDSDDIAKVFNFDFYIPQGPQGEQGLQGPMPNVQTTASVTTLPLHSSPTVSTSTVNNNIHFDFGIPESPIPQMEATVSTSNLEPGELADVSVTVNDNIFHFDFGIPQGIVGQDGIGINNIEFKETSQTTGGNIYTVNLSNSTSTTIESPMGPVGIGFYQNIPFTSTDSTLWKYNNDTTYTLVIDRTSNEIIPVGIYNSSNRNIAATFTLAASTQEYQYGTIEYNTEEKFDGILYYIGKAPTPQILLGSVTTAEEGNIIINHNNNDTIIDFVLPTKGIKGDTGNGIESITTLSINGTTTTYRINFTDNSNPFDFSIKNGIDGNSIESIENLGTEGLTTTYKINFINENINPFYFNIKNGEDGVSISSIDFHTSTELQTFYTITYSNGTTTDFSVYKGDKGDTGNPGNSIQDINLIDHNITTRIDTYEITLTDGTTTSFQVTNGEKGTGISSISMTTVENGKEYTIEYSDDTPSYSFIVEKGDQGEQGIPGPGITNITGPIQDPSNPLRNIYTIYYGTSESTKSFVVQDGTNGTSQFSQLLGSPYDNTSLSTVLDNKVNRGEIVPIEYGTSVNAIGTASAGSANSASRSDHVHNISLATGDNKGQVKIAGTNINVNGLSNDTNNNIQIDGKIISNSTIVSSPGSGVNWIQGTSGSGAGIYVKKHTLDINQYIPGITIQTKSGGGWAIGNYNNENLIFTYGTSTNISNATNSTVSYSISPEGVFSGKASGISGSLIVGNGTEITKISATPVSSNTITQNSTLATGNILLVYEA